MFQATQWLVTLQTSDEQELNAVWPKFDAWLETSEKHRAAYATVRAHWLRLNGLPPDPPRTVHRNFQRGRWGVNRWMANLDSEEVEAWMVATALALALCVFHIL